MDQGSNLTQVTVLVNVCEESQIRTSSASKKFSELNGGVHRLEVKSYCSSFSVKHRVITPSFPGFHCARKPRSTCS
jgi:hypothetical protein